LELSPTMPPLRVSAKRLANACESTQKSSGITAGKYLAR
jgi:hypothetical protein